MSVVVRTADERTLVENGSTWKVSHETQNLEIYDTSSVKIAEFARGSWGYVEQA